MSNLNLINGINVLLETQLSVAEILKPNSQTGEPRVEILYNLIQRGDDIELKDGSTVKIDPAQSKQALAVLKTNEETSIRELFGARGESGKVFVTTNGQRLALSAFKKTAVFGGGTGGSGGGAEKTAVQESAQAVLLAAAHGKKSISESDLTPAALKAANKWYNISVPVEQVISLLQDNSWRQSLIVATNTILKTENVSGMVFHHQDEWVKHLENTFNYVNRNEGKFFSNINKWNPSDIWAVRPGVKPPMGDEANTLVELNAWIQSKYESDDVIGFSLKKVGKTAQIKRINYHGDVDELLNITIKQLLISKKNELFGSKDANIVFESYAATPFSILDEDEIQFRSFGGDDPIQGEIKGKHAAHGKVGHGAINKILSRLGMKTITDRKTIYEMRDMDKKSKAERYAPVVERIIDNAKIVNPTIAKAAEAELRTIASEIDHNVLISKFQAVELMAIIKRTRNKEKRETFIQQLIGMAQSRTELSSVFVKVW